MHSQQIKNNSAKKQVLVIDDHPIVRHGLKQLIDQEKDLAVCAEAEDEDSAIKAINKALPDVAVIDLSLKGASGLDLVKRIKTKWKFPMLIVSIHDENIYAERVIRAGAKGYIMKQEATEQLMMAIRHVLQGEIYLSERMNKQLVQKYIHAGDGPTQFGSSIAKLSNREIDIYRFIGEGQGTRKIAENLKLSIKTVESHRAHIKQKLRLDSGTELVHTAIQWVQSEKK